MEIFSEIEKPNIHLLLMKINYENCINKFDHAKNELYSLHSSHIKKIKK